MGKDDRAFFSSPATTTTPHLHPLQTWDMPRLNPGHRYVGSNDKSVGVIATLNTYGRKSEMLHRYLALVVEDRCIWDHWIILAKKSLSCKS